MKYLFAIWDGAGTVPPELGVARRLIERGHSVRVLADPTLQTEVEHVGAVYEPWRRAPHRKSLSPEDNVLKDWECRTPLEQFARVRDRIITGPADLFAEEVREACTRERPDAIVADGVILGALIAAESLRIPGFALCPAFYPLPHPELPLVGTGFSPGRGPLGRARDRLLARLASRLWNTGLHDVNRARAAFGLDPLTDVWQQLERAGRLLVLTPAAFDFPARLPEHVRYVGPVVDDPGWAQTDVELPPGDGPLVLVAGSSDTTKGQADMLRRVVAALDLLQVRGLVTTGHGTEVSDVPGTDRVRVVERAPHWALLPQASLMVTHAGHGTVIKSLTAGVPLVCLPAQRDQRDNTTRARRLGAAVSVKASARPDRIAAAIRRVLEDPAYREAARRFAASVQDELRQGALMEELEGRLVPR